MRLDLPKSGRTERTGEELLETFLDYRVHKLLPLRICTTTPETCPVADLPPAGGTQTSAGHQTGSAIQPLGRFHQPLPRTKQLHLDGVLVHPRLFRQLLHGKALNRSEERRVG